MVSDSDKIAYLSLWTSSPNSTRVVYLLSKDFPVKSARLNQKTAHVEASSGWVIHLNDWISLRSRQWL